MFNLCNRFINRYHLQQQHHTRPCFYPCTLSVERRKKRLFVVFLTSLILCLLDCRPILTKTSLFTCYSTISSYLYPQYSCQRKDIHTGTDTDIQTYTHSYRLFFEKALPLSHSQSLSHSVSLPISRSLARSLGHSLEESSRLQSLTILEQCTTYSSRQQDTTETLHSSLTLSPFLSLSFSLTFLKINPSSPLG